MGRQDRLRAVIVPETTAAAPRRDLRNLFGRERFQPLSPLFGLRRLRMKAFRTRTRVLGLAAALALGAGTALADTASYESPAPDEVQHDPAPGLSPDSTPEGPGGWRARQPYPEPRGPHVQAPGDDAGPGDASTRNRAHRRQPRAGRNPKQAPHGRREPPRGWRDRGPDATPGQDRPPNRARRHRDHVRDHGIPGRRHAPTHPYRGSREGRVRPYAPGPSPSHPSAQ